MPSIKHGLRAVASLMLLTTLSAGRAKAQNAAQNQNVVVVVNSGSPVTTIAKNTLSDIFLKKVTHWPDGRPAIPVDQERSAKVRDEFSRWIHDRSASAIATYWQTQIFSGNNVPPVTKASDADVLAFVRANANAVGYVSASAALGTGVKAVTVSP